MLDVPPAWLLLFLAIAYLQSWFWPVLMVKAPLLDAIGWVLFGLGIVLMFWAFTEFLRRKTSVVPRRVPSAFIAGGPYRFSRNPIYLADMLMLAGLVLVFGSLIGLLLVPLLMAVIHHRFIKGEEAGLSRAFPEEFAQFCRRTRRWL